MLYYIILCYVIIYILYYIMLYDIILYYITVATSWGLTAMFCKSSCGTTISKERCWDENRAAERSGGLVPQAILWEITPLSFKIRWENTIVGRSTMYIPLVILRLQHTYWMILWSWTCFRLSNPLVDYKQTLHIFAHHHSYLRYLRTKSARDTELKKKVRMQMIGINRSCRAAKHRSLMSPAWTFRKCC